MRVPFATACAAVVLLSVSPAAAFTRAPSFGNPAVSDDPELNGGGDGRWFTGSPRDGFTCAVCHQGGNEEAVEGQVEVRGLPLEGWVPGQVYELVLELPELPPEPGSTEVSSQSGALEITDRAGDAVGTLSVVEDLCPEVLGMDGQPLPRVPRVEIIASEGRQIAMGNQCGSDQLTITWTTPGEPVTGVSLSAVAVGGNGLGDPDGDVAVLVQRQLNVAGDIGEGPRVGTACGVGIGSSRPGSAALVLLVAIGLLGLRRRR